MENMEHEYIIAHADKSVLKISGVKIKGLNTAQIEKILEERMKTFVRVIGVTGDAVEMDVYNIDPEQIRRDEKGVIEAVSLAEGITVTDLTKMACSEKILDVNFDDIPDQPLSACAKERWIKWRKN